MDLDNLDDLLENALGPDDNSKKGALQAQKFVNANQHGEWDDADPYPQQSVQQVPFQKQTSAVSDWDALDDSDWGNDDNKNNYINSKHNSQQQLPRQNKKAPVAENDEFDDLMGDANFADVQMASGLVPSQRAKQDPWSYEVPGNQQKYQQPQVVVNQEEPGECYPLFIAGSAYMSGRTDSSLKPYVCSKLRCVHCDKKIVRFEFDVKWKESVDYLFVRNYNTQPEKLQEGVEPAPGYSAYACQCQFISVSQLTKLETLEHLQWHCGNH